MYISHSFTLSAGVSWSRALQMKLAVLGNQRSLGVWAPIRSHFLRICSLSRHSECSFLTFLVVLFCCQLLKVEFILSILIQMYM